MVTPDRARILQYQLSHSCQQTRSNPFHDARDIHKSILAGACVTCQIFWALLKRLKRTFQPCQLPTYANNFVSASNIETLPPAGLLMRATLCRPVILQPLLPVFFQFTYAGNFVLASDTTAPHTDAYNPCCDMQETFWQPIACTKVSDPFGYVSQEFRRFGLRVVGIRPARSRLSKFLKFSISFDCARILSSSISYKHKN
jgi:hypothetical protein